MPDVSETAQAFRSGPFESDDALSGSTETSANLIDNVDSELPPFDNAVAFVTKMKRYILLTLGYPNVEVELCDEQLEWAIENSLDEFVRHNLLDSTRYWRIPTATNVSQYALPPDLTIVRDVSTLKIAEFDTVFGTDILVNPLYLRNSKEAYQDILTFWLSEAAFETWRRVYGLNLSWDVIEGGKLIRVYPTPRETRYMIIKGSYRPTMTTFDERSLKNKHELFRRLIVAHAMTTLGRIRGKRVSGINTSQGVVQLDGNELRQEAATDLEKIRIELLASGNPKGFYTG